MERERILAENAEAYARTALANIQREYPASVPYFITGPGPLPSPRQRHPAFFGSLDWHSSVEMHWVLVRLLRLFPAIAVASEARAVLDDHLSVANLATETAYFETRRGFERPYGWGWLLTLAHELATFDDAGARRWAASIAPLARVIRDRFLAWLPKATYPQRTGLHGNTAFGLLLAWDRARAEEREGSPDLANAIRDAAQRWYGRDTAYDARFEPSGSDFLSPALTEMALMTRVLARDEFARWSRAFLPELPSTLRDPAVVTDPSDGQGAHLHGLNLSRAYCLRLVADALPAEDPRIAPMRTAMDRHAAASLPFVVGSDYMVEHWLAAYALLALGPITEHPRRSSGTRPTPGS